MSECIPISAGTPERVSLHQTLSDNLGTLYQAAHHVCAEMPKDTVIWLNEVEAPEYWVMRPVDSPMGDDVQTCPFCGANLSKGEGNAVLIKTNKFPEKGEQR